MKDWLDESANYDHPLQILKKFLDDELSNELARKYDLMRFVGYVLEIGYDSVTMITADRFKVNVGGVPRNSLLIMTPANLEGIPLHFTILRVLESAPTPLSREVQQTYFELQKRSMPELDIFTNSELQWGALKSGVLGMFYEHPEKDNKIEFSGDLNNFVSAHKYRVYSPTPELLDLIVNSLVPDNNRFSLGKLRLTECRLGERKEEKKVDVFVSSKDFMATRTAMFGKTRLGKSNIVKLIAQSLIETTKEGNSKFEIDDVTLRTLEQLSVPLETLTSLNALKGKVFESLKEFKDSVAKILSYLPKDKLSEFGKLVVHHSTTRVGQLIFDINGEYANDNPQDGNHSLAGAYPDVCIVYALTPKPNTPSKPLKLDFYSNPSDAVKILGTLLREAGRNSIYIQNFLSVDLPSIDSINEMDINDRTRARRKILYYWAILHKAGFRANLNKIKFLLTSIDPEFNKEVKNRIWGNEENWKSINSLDDLQDLLEKAIEIDRSDSNNRLPSSTKGKNLFDPDDVALLNFLQPTSTISAGASILQSFRKYHDAEAGNFVSDILSILKEGKTVILDLGNANEEIMRYFSRELSQAVFQDQVSKFTSNTLGKHYVQLYFEEAHNLFSASDTDKATEIYRRFAKEGAKYHIGMVYSTQSPTTVNKDLLSQTENFFILHLASEEEVNALAKLNVTYKDIRGDILQSKTPGYVRMLTRSHRFVISVQANRFALLKRSK
ncbi:MAG: ATP-binding protein [Pseudanabaena sp. M046S1SP1A06QC]|nr:ATP-binding protein [Pseudanabaena sp. M046S1SP1A06QC]